MGVIIDKWGDFGIFSVLMRVYVTLKRRVTY